MLYGGIACLVIGLLLEITTTLVLLGHALVVIGVVLIVIALVLLLAARGRADRLP